MARARPRRLHADLLGNRPRGWRASFELSGSSLFTLGFTRPEGLGSTALIFAEAAIGLFLLALLVTYLPSIDAAYSRREVGITALEVRAGSASLGPRDDLAVLAP